MQSKKIIMGEFIYYGQEPKEIQIEMWARELDFFSNEEILKAYKSLRNSHTKVPLPQFVKRILLGYVDSDEAWSLLPMHEDDSAVWNQAIRLAWGSVKDLINVDIIAARMAFKKSHDSEILNMLSKNEKAKWDFSPGNKKELRDQKLIQAIDRGWIKPKAAIEWSPEIALTSKQMLQIVGPQEFDPEKKEKNLNNVKDFLSKLSKKNKTSATEI